MGSSRKPKKEVAAPKAAQGGKAARQGGKKTRQARVAAPPPQMPLGEAVNGCTGPKKRLKIEVEAPVRVESALAAQRSAHRAPKRSKVAMIVEAPKTREAQPLSGLKWVDPKELKANSYNPNRVASIEMQLLKLSIISDGWTQPIVARTDGEIVDGFHRWTLGSTDKDVRSLTGGLVPVVRVADTRTKADQMMSTIRHNRARGSHLVVKMADIVRKLHEEGMTEVEIMNRLGMEHEEVDRLLDSSGMTKRGASTEFNKGWVPK